MAVRLDLFFFNDTGPTEFYTLSLHDALPICLQRQHLVEALLRNLQRGGVRRRCALAQYGAVRSEEHTSELQSQSNLVCRLLLEKKKELLFRQSSSQRRSLHDGQSRFSSHGST